MKVSANMISRSLITSLIVLLLNCFFILSRTELEFLEQDDTSKKAKTFTSAC